MEIEEIQKQLWGELNKNPITQAIRAEIEEERRNATPIIPTPFLFLHTTGHRILRCLRRKR